MKIRTAFRSVLWLLGVASLALSTRVGYSHDDAAVPSLAAPLTHQFKYEDKPSKKSAEIGDLEIRCAIAPNLTSVCGLLDKAGKSAAPASILYGTNRVWRLAHSSDSEEKLAQSFAKQGFAPELAETGANRLMETLRSEAAGRVMAFVLAADTAELASEWYKTTDVYYDSIYRPAHLARSGTTENHSLWHRFVSSNPHLIHWAIVIGAGLFGVVVYNLLKKKKVLA